MAIKIFKRLQTIYPSPKSSLIHKNAWELLVATVLAAQCSDARVNTVTPEFFKRWSGPSELALADLTDIEILIYSTGLFRNKAKNLLALARRVVDSFQGRVPQTMAELITLPGVARKTANIVLSNAFGVHEGIAVDTHVARLAFRLNLTDHQQPTAIEKDLMTMFACQGWGKVNHYFVLLGREACQSRIPRCAKCHLTDICPKKEV